jgi:Zn-dependent protease with chaperone function
MPTDRLGRIQRDVRLAGNKQTMYPTTEAGSAVNRAEDLDDTRPLTEQAQTIVELLGGHIEVFFQAHHPRIADRIAVLKEFMRTLPSP